MGQAISVHGRERTRISELGGQGDSRQFLLSQIIPYQFCFCFRSLGAAKDSLVRTACHAPGDFPVRAMGGEM